MVSSAYLRLLIFLPAILIPACDSSSPTFSTMYSAYRASLVAKLVAQLQCRKPWFDSWVGKIPWKRERLPTSVFLGFPGDSVSKESACNARNPGLIPGLGRSPGEGIGYTLQYSWASLVTQSVKNPSAMWETWAWSLSWEDPLDEGMPTHSSILAWRIPMNRGA